MRSRLSYPLALLIGLAVLLAAGCGGDDQSSSTATDAGTGAALTEEEFVKQGNAICAAGNRELDRAARETFTGQQPTDAQIQQFADILVPSIQGQIDGIRALPAPEDIAAEVGTFLDDAQSALDEIEADPSLLAAGNGQDNPFAGVNQQASDLGLTECAG